MTYCRTPYGLACSYCTTRRHALLGETVGRRPLYSQLRLNFETEKKVFDIYVSLTQRAAYLVIRNGVTKYVVEIQSRKKQLVGVLLSYNEGGQLDEKLESLHVSRIRELQCRIR